MRLDAAAGMELRVDERSQPTGSLNGRIEFEAQLGQHRQVGSEAGGGHQQVDGQLFGPGGPVCEDSQAAPGCFEACDRERCVDIDDSGFNECPQAGPERSACGELVAILSTVDT